MSVSNPVLGFTGSRTLGFCASSLVAHLVHSHQSKGFHVAVGCARGGDALVRSACPSAQVFHVQGRSRSAFAVRSTRLVHHIAQGGVGSLLVGFATRSCPGAVVPSASSSRCFCGAGSGTWASLALAVGLGVPVVVFVFGSATLPSWPGGQWYRGQGVFAGGWVFRSF